MKNTFDLRNFLTENKLTTNSKLVKEEADIKGIRNAVQGPEADAIFKAAQGFLDDGDADSMEDALDMAADQYYELYDRKGNEDGLEVAKYIMNSLPKPKKSNVQDFSKLKNYDDLDKSKITVSRGTLSKDS